MPTTKLVVQVLVDGSGVVVWRTDGRWLGDSESETYSSQASEFGDSENAPAWHDSHVDEPGSAEKRPASQTVHNF